MTVDMLSATFVWHDLPPPAGPAEPAPGVPEEAQDAAARAEGFWSAVVRHLWHPRGAPALP